MKHLVFCIVIICCSLTTFAIAPITGTLIVCVGATTALSDATPLGTWSSGTPGVATTGSSTGIVTGVSPGTVRITYSIGTDSTFVIVTVNPTPALTSPLTPPAICDSAIFAYVPVSTMTGTTFSWSRSYVLGISNPATTGTGTVSEALYNTTAVPIAVTYVYILSAGGCTNTQNVMVTVNPTPRLSSSVTPPMICDSETFNYTPMSTTVGAIFRWDRPLITGIAGPATTGFGNPIETLINTSALPIAVTYTYTLTANGCIGTQNVTVTINPTPMLSSTLTPPAICDSQYFSYTPTSATPGVTYAWNRPGILGILPPTAFFVDTIHEYLINTTGGPVTVTYIYRLSINGCINTFTQSVTVVVDTCTTSLVSNVNNPIGSIKITPNPSANILSISGLENVISVEIFNTFGERVYSKKGINASQLTVDLSEQPTGTYYVIATGSDGVMTGKILKQ